MTWPIPGTLPSSVWQPTHIWEIYSHRNTPLWRFQQIGKSPVGSLAAYLERGLSMEHAWRRVFEKLTPALSHFTLKASYSLTADRGPAFVTNSRVVYRNYSPYRPFADVKESGLQIEDLENSELTYEKSMNSISVLISALSTIGSILVQTITPVIIMTWSESSIHKVVADKEWNTPMWLLWSQADSNWPCLPKTYGQRVFSGLRILSSQNPRMK